MLIEMFLLYRHFIITTLFILEVTILQTTCLPQQINNHWLTLPRHGPDLLSSIKVIIHPIERHKGMCYHIVKIKKTSNPKILILYFNNLKLMTPNKILFISPIPSQNNYPTLFDQIKNSSLLLLLTTFLILSPTILSRLIFT